MIPLAQQLMAVAFVLGGLIVVSLGRAFLGPTMPDRVIAVDAINTLAIAALVVLGAAFREIIYIDVAIIYAVLGFVSTLYFAKYLEENA